MPTTPAVKVHQVFLATVDQGAAAVERKFGLIAKNVKDLLATGHV